MEKKRISLITLVVVIIIVLLLGIGIGYLITNSINNETIEKEYSDNNRKEQSEEKQVSNKENITIIENASSYNYTDIKDFWSNFRSAVLSNNYTEIKKFVEFPLKTRGPYDSNPILEVSEENFEEVFSKFLEKDTAVMGTTEYDWIKGHEMPKMLGGKDYDNAGDYINLVRLENDNLASFSGMEMKKDSNGYWKLSLIYTGDSNQEDTSSYNYADIKDFWTNFRSAVLSNNYTEIKKFVEFPFKTRGPYDSNPILEVSEENFEKVFSKFLEQNTFLRGTTEYDWIKEHEMPRILDENDYDNAENSDNIVRLEDNNCARFSDMVIKKDSNGYWKLSFIYTEE